MARIKFKIIVALLFCLVWLTYACADIFEESIEKEVVVILTPRDGTVSRNYTQTFWWEPVEYALTYRLQIVYNSFDTLTTLRLDTVITKDRFTTTLNPATYQWKVVALNGSSKTEYSTIQNLRIDSTSIEEQSVLLTSPGANYTKNDPLVNFQWEALPGAKEYAFKLYATNSTVVLDTVLNASTEMAYTIKKDSIYFWEVTGKRNTVFSMPSEQRKFTIDRKAPDSVNLKTPLSGEKVTSPVTLSWQASASKDIAFYEIYVYKNTSSTPFSSKYNPYSTDKDSNPLKTSLSFTEGIAGDKIIYKVRTVDKAGNRSSNEKLRSFSIQ